MLDLEKIKQLFQNSYTQINTNHSEAYYAFKSFTDKTEKKIPILVNYDTHSDIYQNFKLSYNDLNIANWVNYCIRDFHIKEIFWVIPQYITENKRYKRIYENQSECEINRPLSGFDNTPLNLNEINKQEVYFNTKTGELISPQRKIKLEKNCNQFNMSSVFEKAENLTKINLYILASGKLNLLKGKEILLSIDSDYFCNSGFDTNEGINNKMVSKEDLINSFNTFTSELLKNEIKPIAVSLSYSPIYTLKKFRPQIQEFYEAIEKSSLHIIR